MPTEIDHLVVVADSLDQGAAWCKATLGVVPGPGGKHAFMGTHNRLLNLSSPAFPACYLEIIAIDPDAAAPTRPRWFGMDDPGLRARVQSAPRLVHFVARSNAIDDLHAALAAVGQDAGQIVAAERQTPQGLLTWRLALQLDGNFAGRGALPTMIEWRGAHPTDSMPASPVGLAAIHLAGLPEQAVRALALPGVKCDAAGDAADDAGQAMLRLTLDTPLGRVTLSTDD